MVSRVRGVSLVELVITLVLIGILALLAGPFTINWLILSDIQRAKGQLIQAHGVAKAVALRNATGGVTGEAVVTIQVDDDSRELQVVCARGSCNDDVLWQAGLPRGVSLSFDAGAVSAIEMDNSGRLLSGDGGIIYQISKGGQSEDGGLY